MRTHLLASLDDRLTALPAGALLGLTAVITAVLATGDFLTGADVGFTTLYVGPVAFATWYVHPRAAWAVAAVASCASLLTAVLEGRGAVVTGWNVVMQLLALLVVAWLVAALQQALRDARSRADTDALTQVFSRAAFLLAAQRELDRAVRFKRPFTLAYVDVDAFKQVNDTLGHAAGDALLVDVAATIRDELRALDVVGRLGGDEFALVLPEMGRDAARDVVARLHTRLVRSVRELPVPVGFSIGVASFPDDGGDLNGLLATADRRMYESKRAQVPVGSPPRLRRRAPTLA